MRFDYAHQATILGLDCEHNLEGLRDRFTVIGLISCWEGVINCHLAEEETKCQRGVNIHFGLLQVLRLYSITESWGCDLLLLPRRDKMWVDPKVFPNKRMQTRVAWT